ncbi:MAG: hypothetical protein AAFY58_04065 [Planctomycetota bacterium]
MIGLIASAFPVGDWQFWVATILALGALVYLLRKVVPVVLPKRKKQRSRATLTVEGRAVDRKG